MPSLFPSILFFFDTVVFWYFVVLNVFYLVLLWLASRVVARYRDRLQVEQGIRLPSHFQKPFSVLVPAYNEEAGLVEAVEALLRMAYPEFEVIVCNDGSTDGTLSRLIEAFGLEAVDVERPEGAAGASVRGVYFSRRDFRLAVIDKENTGKADSLNVAAAYSRYPYVCAVDADSVLAPDSMEKLMQEFVAVPGTVAVGGIVRLMNGAVVENGRVRQLRLPRTVLERIQIVEYFRGFLFGRVGLARLNVLMIISGAFGVFRRDVLDQAGGWWRAAIGEDMELVVGLQRLIHERRVRGRVGFSPYPVCWTQAPATFEQLGVQRDRWQRALVQCLMRHVRLFFNPFYGALGLIGYPYYFVFEMLGALVELLGYPLVVFSFIMGTIHLPFFLMFLAVAMAWGLCISCTSLVLAEMSFRRYPDRSAPWNLVVAAFFENFGYRQIHAWWRVRGMVKYLFGRNREWGRLVRREFKSEAGDEEP